MEVSHAKIAALKRAWDRASNDFSFDAVKAWPGDLYDAIEAIVGAAAEPGAEVPPAEPPIGTAFYRGDDFVPVWTRREDGWYCARPPGSCPHCPAQWAEVWDVGGIRDDPSVRRGEA